MKRKMLQVAGAEENLLVDLTFHDLPASLLKEFALQVVKPYYFGSFAEAVKDLMQKAIADQKFVQRHMREG